MKKTVKLNVFLFVAAFTLNVGTAAEMELSHCTPQVGSEELYARQAAEKFNLPNEELLARIIFSEALSTGYWKKRCEAPSSAELMEGIGWGIMNRVKQYLGKGNPYREVIFQKNQFRTSFSGKKKNPFAIAFLCPMKAQEYLDETSSKPSVQLAYREAQKTARSILDQFNENKTIPSRYHGITNFFYPKSEFFGEVRPSWAKDSVVKNNKGYVSTFKSQKPCIEFYRLK